jgi:hypothetical protein
MENINIEKDYAFCNICQNIFKISDLLNSDEIKLSNEIINNPPRGTWKHEDYNEILIGSTTRSPVAFVFVPFMTVWTGGSVGGIIYNMVIEGKFSLFLFLVGLPFLAVSIFVWKFVLMTVAGKVEISIGKGNSYVFRGIGKIGIRKRFDWKLITKIYEEKKELNPFFPNNRYDFTIYMEEKTKIYVIKGLKHSRRNYVLSVLNYYNNKRKNYGT